MVNPVRPFVRGLATALVAASTVALAACGGRPAEVERVYVSGQFGGNFNVLNELDNAHGSILLEGVSQGDRCTGEEVNRAAPEQAPLLADLRRIDNSVDPGWITRSDDLPLNPTMADDAVITVCGPDGRASATLTAQGRYAVTGDESVVGNLGNDVQEINGNKLLQGRIVAAWPTVQDGKMLGVTALGSDGGVFPLGVTLYSQSLESVDANNFTGCVVSAGQDLDKFGGVCMFNGGRQERDSLAPLRPSENQQHVLFGNMESAHNVLAAVQRAQDLGADRAGEALAVLA